MLGRIGVTEVVFIGTSDAFGAGVGRTVVVGSDCPDVTAELVRTAFDRLDNHDLVLGPAPDQEARMLLDHTAS